MRSINLVQRLLLILIITYLTVIGATYNGILAFPQMRFWTLVLLGGVAISWLIRHRGWRWQKTPLDVAWLLGFLAIGLSVLANPETWRRSAEGIWYIGLYAGVWYILADSLRNGLRRTVLAEAFLVVSAIVVLVGYTQVIADATQLGIPRPVSFLGNPNTLGAYLVLLLPLVSALALSQRRPVLLVTLGTVALISAGLLGLTASRGAWIGALAGCSMVGVCLWLGDNSLSWSTVRSRWQKATRLKRRLAVIAFGLSLSVVFLVAFIIAGSLSAPGRSSDLRLILWQSAIDQFLQQPFTGQGFFTYGRQLGLAWSIPPEQAHSHAHNVPFTVLAELGIAGLIALFFAVGLVVVGVRRTIRQTTGYERLITIGAGGGVLGFAVHHLFDTPAMMPLIALLGTGFCAIACVTPGGAIIQAGWRGRSHAIGMFALWIILLGLGLIQSERYARYYDAVRSALTTGEYTPALAVLEGLQRDDPQQPVYWLQAAQVRALAAMPDDMAQASRAITELETFIRLEPYFAPAWANLAGLYWQTGRTSDAQSSIVNALTLAPDWPHYARQAALYQQVGDSVAYAEPPETPWSANMARFQFLHDVISREHIPQAGFVAPDAEE